MPNFDKNEQRDNTGVLFVNQRKNNEKQPDYTGRGKINGKEMSISGWRRTASNGNQFISIALSEPYVPQNQQTVELPQGTNYQQSAAPRQPQGQMPTHTPMGGAKNDDLPW